MNYKKNIMLLVLSVLLAIGGTFGITYAYLSVSTTQSNNNTFATVCYNMTFAESDRINITSYPMSSNSAFNKLTPYKFSITNNCETNNDYQIILNIMNTTSSKIIPYINYSLDRTNVNKMSSLSNVNVPSGVSTNNVMASYIIDTGKLNGINASKSYNLYMWIDESAGNDIMGSTFEAQVVVYSVAK